MTNEEQTQEDENIRGRMWIVFYKDGNLKVDRQNVTVADLLAAAGFLDYTARRELTLAMNAADQRQKRVVIPGPPTRPS